MTQAAYSSKMLVTHLSDNSMSHATPADNYLHTHDHQNLTSHITHITLTHTAFTHIQDDHPSQSSIFSNKPIQNMCNLVKFQVPTTFPLIAQAFWDTKLTK